MLPRVAPRFRVCGWHRPLHGVIERVSNPAHRLRKFWVAHTRPATCLVETGTKRLVGFARDRSVVAEGVGDVVDDFINKRNASALRHHALIVSYGRLKVCDQLLVRLDRVARCDVVKLLADARKGVVDYLRRRAVGIRTDPTQRRRLIEIRLKKKDSEGNNLEVLYRREYTLKPMAAPAKT